MSNEQNKQKNVSRRDFLKNSAVAGAGVLVGGGIFSALNPKEKKSEGHEQHTAVKKEGDAETHHAMMFFTNTEDFKTIEAAAERIFPETEEGPGAKGLGVGYYIDHQLYGAWGNNTKEYHVGPFFESEAVPEQGYQTRLTRAEVFTLGIETLTNEAQSRHQKLFFELENEQQDAILKDFESDKVKMRGTATPKYFFGLLRQATIEGAYSDPLYGGNKDMQGWKMKKFPGANTAQFSQVVDKEKFVTIEPQSLKDHMGH